jgi:hypothetical protein
VKYLCLAYYDEKKFNELSESELTALVSQCPPHDAALHASGHLISVASLGPPGSAAFLRPRKGKISTTDGPFIETNEQVGSFFLIEAADMEEAIRIASLHPAAHLGDQVGWGIEVRQVDFFHQS